MLSAARGLTLIYSGGRPIPALTDGYSWIGTGDIAGIPVPIILFGMVFALSHFVLTRTRFGRHVYAVGDDKEAAELKLPDSYADRIYELRRHIAWLRDHKAGAA